MYTNYNMYNYDIINQLLDYYIYICSINNKEISIMGFSKLTKIDTENIYLERFFENLLFNGKHILQNRDIVMNYHTP